jgi:hypothetical protein
MRSVLVTGFETFGGHDENPSALVATTLDGREIAGARVIGRILPVDLDGLDAALDAALADQNPDAVLAFGLAGNEAVIRLERVALNVADFGIPDNAGGMRRNAPLEPGGPDARFSRLPLEAILDATLAAGIPARLSDTAGLYPDRPTAARRGWSSGRARRVSRLATAGASGRGRHDRRGDHPRRTWPPRRWLRKSFLDFKDFRYN